MSSKEKKEKTTKEKKERRAASEDRVRSASKEKRDVNDQETRASAGSKEKKEKKSKRSKDGSEGSAAHESKDVKRSASGTTVYRRHKVKVEKGGKSKTNVLWVPDGMSMSDKAFVWQEQQEPSGSGTFFFNIGDPERREWELPDLPQSLAPSSDAGDLPGVTLEKKKFKPRKEWKDEAAQKSVLAAAKKSLLGCPGNGELSKEEFSIFSGNIAKEFMSRFKKLDSEGAAWINETTAAQLEELVAARNAAAEMLEAKRKKAESLTHELIVEDSGPLPLHKMSCGPPPLSPMLPRAWYIRDPYFYRRLKVPNPQRTPLEGKIESIVFLQPGCGTVRVLCAVPVKLGERAERPTIACVVRDWLGAFNLMFVDMQSDIGQGTVNGAYPILDHVEFAAGFSKIEVRLDDIPFIMSFRDQAGADVLHDSLKMAMCSMYGLGREDARIVAMRAYSVEFSCLELNYYPDSKVPDAAQLMQIILSEEGREGEALDKQFQQLRLCMRTVEGRDSIIRRWIRSVDEGAVFKKKSLPMLHNHLRIVEEAMRAPAYHEDATLPDGVVQRLLLLRTDQPEAEKHRIDALKTTCKIVNRVMEQWRSRNEMPDIDFEPMFDPVEGTPAAQESKRALAEIRANYAKNQAPPGIYITMLCYCGNQVLCDAMGNLFSEVVVSQATDKELEDFNVANRDFRWILRLGGVSESWAQSLHHWATIYDNVGWHTFRAKFLHAARRLLESQRFSSLGVIFDVPIIQKSVSCAHVLCIQSIDSKDKVPASVGEWRDLETFESTVYLQAMIASHSSRVSFLPTSYNRCMRFVKAAMDYRIGLDRRLDPGFYAGFLVFAADSQGPMMLVPETNRFLPPMALVSEEMPSLEKWRWIQGLNERHRRTQSFGFDAEVNPDTPLEHVAFEQRFARCVKELEVAVGLPIKKFYDMELFVLDEGQQCRGIFAVHFVQQTFTPTSNGLTVPASPPGAVPMVWKHLDVIEESYFRLYWPQLFGALTEERDTHFRRAYSTAQPFVVDEVVRLQQESALGYYTALDKYSFLISWARQLFAWGCTDAQTLVEKHGGSEDESIARSVEEAVEVAVTNLSMTLDNNISTIKSLLIDAGSSPHFSWQSILARIRELDRVVTSGYAQRIVTSLPQQSRQTKMRTYDELFGDEESDDEQPREATVYELPCTLEELIFKDMSVESANKYFQMQEIVNDIVDLASVDCVDVGGVKEIGNIITDMISVIESTEDLIDNAALLSLKSETEDEAWLERERFQQHWLDVFHNDAELLDQASRRGVDPGSIQQGIGAADHPLVDDEDDDDADVDDPMSTALFYDGSRHTLNSLNDGVRACIAKAHNSAYQLQQLLMVANSAAEALELVQCVQEYASTVNTRETLLGRDAPDVSAPSRSPRRGSASGAAADDGPFHPGAAAVTIVSKEFQEFPVVTVDPLRCLVLHHVSGKVRFPTISTAAMEVLARHLDAPDFNVPQTLSDMRFDTQVTEHLLEMSIQMKAPLLLLRLATLLFGSTSGSSAFFTSTAALQVKQLVQEGFLFEYGIKDWLHIEVLGGAPVAAAMDVIWWIRFTKEATATAAGTVDRREAFADHEGSWKQVYAETRVKVFLSHGVHALGKDEVALWAQALGRYVEYLSLRDSAVSDAEVEVLVNCCPNLKSLDLSHTNITSRAVELLVANLRLLVECAVASCDLHVSDQDQLRRHCMENKRKMT